MNKNVTLSTEISNRLFITVLSAWIVLAGLVAVGLWTYYHTDQAYSLAFKKAQELQSGALDLNTAVVSEILNTRAYLISGEEEALTRRQLARQEVNRQISSLQALLAASPEIRLPSLAVLRDLHVRYAEMADQLIQLRQSGQTAEAQQVFATNSDPLVAAIQSANQNLHDELRASLSDLTATYSAHSLQSIVLVAFLFLVGTALGFIALIRLVTPPLRVLDFFENMLINAAGSQIYAPVESGPSLGKQAPRLFAAYNSLIARMNASTATFLKHVSHLNHEGNTLLASILGYASMLADPNLRPEDATMEEYGGIIVQQTQRVIHLVEDFALAAKIEGNQYNPALIPVRLAPLLSSIVKEVAAETHRAIQYPGCAETLRVPADALSLENALRKVIENAVKFSRPPAPVEVWVEVQPAQRSLAIHVRDQGIGIAAQDQPLLFRPFSRIQNEAVRRLPGSGLGLYLAAAILRVHHGEIRLQSAPAQGSTFSLILPVEEA